MLLNVLNTGIRFDRVHILHFPVENTRGIFVPILCYEENITTAAAVNRWLSFAAIQPEVRIRLFARIFAG
jgi:hypothetical protein